MSFLGKYRKALTFSFDDGVADDVRLTELLNRYGLKGTFNLNSARLTDNGAWVYKDVKEVHHINFSEHPHIYDGHEIAVHTVCHLRLQEQTRETVFDEIGLDKVYLQALYGCDIVGMALPFGTYNDNVLDALSAHHILYCRTVKSTYGFGMPDELPLLHPTCHYRDARRDELAEQFLRDDSDDDLLFYIWGHSYELVTEEDWADFEAFLKKVANRDDIYYCTNREALLNHQ